MKTTYRNFNNKIDAYFSWSGPDGISQLIRLPPFNKAWKPDKEKKLWPRYIDKNTLMTTILPVFLYCYVLPSFRIMLKV